MNVQARSYAASVNDALRQTDALTLPPDWPESGRQIFMCLSLIG